ncbi:MAG: carbamoyl-phosphate synthase large subunit [Flavobacteriales bacterium]|nr:carbamoyl-phosphate synthase large subunit [Flavobacteriales bacterium]
MPKDPSIKSVLIIGSGPIIIGQACEFDYSGSQASRSLREEGIEVTLINSNPATIMTDEVTADHIYLLPLTPESIVQILEERQIDAVLPTMGGQTALNLAKEVDELGIWERFGIRIIGVDINAIEKTENREEFRKMMVDLGIGVAPSKIANSFLEGKEAGQKLGFPLVIRPSYTLGGYGGGFVHDKSEFDEALKRGLEASPTHEVLVEKAVLGWKEYELELLRDAKDDIAVICTIENLDPMGIHTGDSITIAPAMTLSDSTFQEMRDMAFRMMRGMGTFAGGCNVQFSVDPDTEQIIAIEINPRVSRSSALASKATGYPIAKIAAKLAIGYYLDELKNPVTKTTSAFFEPAIDYTIVKIPRWNFEKFPGADRKLGLQMKSVGEVMAIGRSFQEALQKACQSLELKRMGLGCDGWETRNLDVILESLKNASWDRIFHIRDAIALGVPITSIQEITKIDRWYLEQIYDLVKTEREIRKYSINNIEPKILRIAKEKGFSDFQIAFAMGNCTEDDVYAKRKELGINRVYKMVDTCSAEFESPTNYFYSTFDGENESVVSNKRKILVLGSGPNRIGQGIEFDYSCVHGLLAAEETGFEAIMVNCNPETVSTDFDTADKLYFEPVFWEHLREIIELEKPEGVIVQLGGQTALKLARNLHESGIPIIGTTFPDMDLAEDRGSFSDLLKELGIPYPQYGVAATAFDAIEIANEVGYPVLVRPSYVLGGQGMKIVINDEELQKAVIELQGDLPGNRILIDHFLDRAEEAESDSICDGEEVEIIGIMEHIEPAGIHSGDSSAVLPPFGFGPEVMSQIEEYTRKIARALRIKGLLNIQFAVKDNKVYVIEANPRASRTVPFICKAYKVPYVNIATKVMLGTHKLSDFNIQPQQNGYAIKKPVFSFNKFPKVNKELGPEMKSTGEAIFFVQDLKDPYFRELYKEKSMYLSK